MPTFKRLKIAGAIVVHIGSDMANGGYRTLCGIRTGTKTVSAQRITESRGDECDRCRTVADGKLKSVGGKPVDGTESPGAIRYEPRTRMRTPLLPKKSN